MPVEFRMETKADKELQPTRSCSRGDSLMLAMAYDGSGRRISKTRYSKACVSDEADGVYAADWERELVTHYTGIGTEVRENYRNNALEKTKVVVNMPNGLGRYGVEDAEKPSSGNATFEWYLKNHLGSTMLVYGTQGSSNTDIADLGEVKAAYDYRATVVAMRTKQQVAKCCPPFGEQVSLMEPTDKVTENFTGKEKDDETELNYFGARYLDPMLGLWVSVDPKRQFASPYLYAGNGYNPVNGVDGDGNDFDPNFGGDYVYATFNQQRSQTNTARFLNAYKDPTRLYRFFDTNGKDGVNKIEPSASPDPNYEHTYDVYISFENFKGGIDGKENYTELTEILIGHELEHPYVFANPGHNYLESVNTSDDYFKSIKKMSTEQKCDPIYLNDYNAAKEMGVYDE